MHAIRLFACALACSIIAIAAPTSLNLSPRAIDKELYDTLRLFAQFATSAYCPQNYNSTGGTKVQCDSGFCPMVEALETVTVLEFENSLITDVTGYVAIEATNNRIVVAFRGTHSARNLLADGDILVVPTDICDDCWVHQGFYDSWLESRSIILACINETALANPSYEIVVVGHSLGGAIADIAVAELRNRGYKAALYTYGAPRIGGAVVSDYITNQPGGNYRVTHLNDPVPRLPSEPLGWRHISPEYFLPLGVGIPVPAIDVEVVTGNFNQSGNSGSPEFDLNAHGWYFWNISCGSFEFV